MSFKKCKNTILALFEPISPISGKKGNALTHFFILTQYPCTKFKKKTMSRFQATLVLDGHTHTRMGTNMNLWDPSV